MIVSLCIVALLAVAAIVAFYPDPDFRAPYHQPRGNAFTGNNTPVVFTGVVLQRLRPSGFWAGVTPAWQGVRYRVESVSVGTISQPEVIVAHVIVGGNALYRNDYPALSKRLFRVGARLRIHAEQLPETGDLVCWEQESNVEQLE